MDELRFRYGGKPIVLALALLFCVTAAVSLQAKARSNDRGLIINHIIRLDTEGATAFLWVMTGLTILLFLLGAAGAVLSLRLGPQYVIIGPQALVVPQGLRQPQIIFYADIRALAVVQRSKFRFLNIDHSSGKATILDNLLPDRNDLETIRAIVAANIRLGRSRSQPLTRP